jgi:hypothetical protein
VNRKEGKQGELAHDQKEALEEETEVSDWGILLIFHSFILTLLPGTCSMPDCVPGAGAKVTSTLWGLP